MCGIAGYKCFGLERPTKNEIESLLVGIMSRGKDATGVAWIENSLQIFKKNIAAKEFIQEEVWNNIMNNGIPATMLLHARAATKGSPNVNTNNHPIFNKEGMALTHNGIISNDNQLRLLKNFTTDGEVDSEVILKLIEKGWWNDIKNINELSGSFACALIYEKKPNELILIRHSNPLALWMDTKRDILFWASTKEILKDTFSKWHRGFKVGSITPYELSDDFAILVDKDGVQDAVELNPAVHWKYDNLLTKNTKKNRHGMICDFCNSNSKSLTMIEGGLICQNCLSRLSTDYASICEVCRYELPEEDIIRGYCSNCKNVVDRDLFYY